MTRWLKPSRGGYAATGPITPGPHTPPKVPASISQPAKGAGMNETDRALTAQWAPDRADGIQSAIFQALGAASMCWERIEDAGVFDSTRAKWVGDGLMEWLREHEAKLFDADYEHALRRHAEEAAAILFESEQRLLAEVAELEWMREGLEK